MLIMTRGKIKVYALIFKDLNKTEFTIWFHVKHWEHSGSVVECLTPERGAAGLTSPASLC